MGAGSRAVGCMVAHEPSHAGGGVWGYEMHGSKGALPCREVGLELWATWHHVDARLEACT
jgi:hypothetical protein